LLLGTRGVEAAVSNEGHTPPVEALGHRPAHRLAPLRQGLQGELSHIDIRSQNTCLAVEGGANDRGRTER